MDNGYSQAVENLAYEINKAATDTVDPIFQQHGLLPSEQVFLMMSSESNTLWADIDNITDVVCSTYKIDPDVLFADVLVELITKYLHGV